MSPNFKMEHRARNVPRGKSGTGFGVFPALLLAITAFLALQLISLYLSWPKQVILGSVSVLIGLAANRLSASRLVTIGLMLISLTATLRYGWWRVRLLIDYFLDQSNNRASLDSVFMLILISAEAYTVLIMVLGYMQTAWPLRRKPLPLPSDDSLWPHVDVLIPTYNEPLPLVRYTALAALNIDYPPEKLHVYILDDGSREDFRAFSEAAGVGYITRTEHNHAKAGNINHALTTMNSPFVTIFDCDHVPTRSFLQMTLGWMLADSNLAMLQTPHHFYSPDPFERNLLQYKTIPNEAALFYGIVQDGNDFWNATFFCGSCALIRRSALDDVGGIATETVTEDAHTSLRMQKQGYNTAYINIPQAAGLSTETLAAHVGQRIRWARGMIQIFRTDNPLLARGMKFTQRLCYLNAMIHFLYAVPRLVFLLSPLVYMLLGRTIIPGYWVAIIAYSIPHLILSNLTNSRIQGRHRHSFWNEIYEAVLAPYILMPTLLALINPKLGEFNVTDKGSTLADTRFDRKIATPTRWMLGLNLLGVLVAPYRMFFKDPDHPGTVIMNLVWILFNMVILGVAAAVAHEQKQRRQSVRIEARIPMILANADGATSRGISVDMSIGGASIQVQEGSDFAMGERLRVAFPEHSGNEQIGATVIGFRGNEVRVAFLVPTIAEQETLTRALYSRADAWISPIDSKELDRPLVSLGRVIVLSWFGIYQICKSLLPEKRVLAKNRAAQTAVLLLAFALALTLPLAALSPISDGPANRKAQPTQMKQAKAIDLPGLNADSLPGPLDPNSSQSSALNTGGVVESVGLKDMGLPQGLEMRGPHAYSSTNFTLSHTLVPRHAELYLLFQFDPALNAHSAFLKIFLNGTQIAALEPKTASDAVSEFSARDIVVPEDLLLRTNTLAFEWVDTRSASKNAASPGPVACRISPLSAVRVSGEHLLWQNDLSQLPLPIFDGDLQTSTTVPIVFLSGSSPKVLQAAGAVASWLGLQAGSKPVRYSVSTGRIPPGNAIVFSSDRSSLPAELEIPNENGPVLALRENPSDPNARILVIAGNGEEQLLTAARALALTRRATPTSAAQGIPLKGVTEEISNVATPAARNIDDAPRWMPANSSVPIADCRAPQASHTDGSAPVPIYFHLRPDLFYGEKQNLKLTLHYRYNGLPIAVGSALRLVVNGTLVSEIPLPPGSDIVDRQREILVPVANLRPFGNTFLFNFDFIPASLGTSGTSSASILQGEILCNSALDLGGLASWAQMPNLELFADAGYPFTQFADLSQTTVILPVAPSTDEISLYLHLMSHFGEQTGYPALRVAIDGPDAVIAKDRDYLILGTLANQPSFAALDPMLPATLDASGIHVKPSQSYLSMLASADWTAQHIWARLTANPLRDKAPSNRGGIPAALIEEIKSPTSLDRSIVLIALQDSATGDSLASVLLDRSHSGDIADSVSLLRNERFESYPVVSDAYHVGNISWYARMRIWMTQNFLWLLLVVSALTFFMAAYIRSWLSAHADERLKLGEPVKIEN
jgi:cellulose synthase (UDP-forming)